MVKKQLLISVLLIVATASVAFALKSYIDYQTAALVLLLVVSILAVSFDILPVLIAALLSGLILNLFFLEPLYHYKIDDSESVLLFFIYIVVALVNTVLTNRLRRQEKKVRDRTEKEKMIKLYGTLFNSLSHELKTPIAAIVGAVDTLKNTSFRLTPGQQADMVSEIETAAYRLEKQVENLLNMSRLEAGNLRIRADWTDINELIYRMTGKIPDDARVRIDFVPDENLPLVRVDEGLIETALYNVVHNSIRYTPDHAPIQIRSTYTENLVSISVKDRGNGIPTENMDDIFRKFYRLPQSGTGGSGLGLSIAKGFVEAHGGRILLENRQSGGAHFTLQIPAAASYLKNLKNE